jgi:hypothetical protein
LVGMIGRLVFDKYLTVWRGEGWVLRECSEDKKKSGGF